MNAIIDHTALPQATLPGIEHRTLAGSAQGLQHLSVWRQTIAPAGATPPHRHDCEEVVLVLSGHGTLYIEDREHAFGPNTTILVAPDVPHRIVNSGTEPLEVVGIFAVAPVDVRWPDGTPLALPWTS